jgi:DNA-binding protein YbaB
MKKFLVIVSTLFILSACGGSSEAPYTTGPSSDPSSITPPDSLPISSTEATADEVEQIERTHQTVTTKVLKNNEERELIFVFNIDEGIVKGVSVTPSFKDPKEQEIYSQIVMQAVFKQISEVEISENADWPELSTAFQGAFDQAVSMYQEKNS